MKRDIKKINYYKFSDKLYSIAISIVIIIVGLFLFFLYNNVYLVMIQAEKVSDLKTKTVADRINQEKMMGVINKINEKNSISITKEKINNPFILKKEKINIEQPTEKEKSPTIEIASDEINNAEMPE